MHTQKPQRVPWGLIPKAPEQVSAVSRGRPFPSSASRCSSMPVRVCRSFFHLVSPNPRRPAGVGATLLAGAEAMERSGSAHCRRVGTTLLRPRTVSPLSAGPGDGRGRPGVISSSPAPPSTLLLPGRPPHTARPGRSGRPRSRVLLRPSPAANPPHQPRRHHPHPRPPRRPRSARTAFSGVLTVLSRMLHKRAKLEPASFVTSKPHGETMSRTRGCLMIREKPIRFGIIQGSLWSR